MGVTCHDLVFPSLIRIQSCFSGTSLICKLLNKTETKKNTLPIVVICTIGFRFLISFPSIHTFHLYIIYLKIAFYSTEVLLLKKPSGIKQVFHIHDENRFTVNGSPDTD